MPLNAMRLNILYDLSPYAAGKNYRATFESLGLMTIKLNFTTDIVLLGQDITDGESSDFANSKPSVKRENECQSIAVGVSCGFYDPEDASDLRVCEDGCLCHRSSFC